MYDARSFAEVEAPAAWSSPRAESSVWNKDHACSEGTSRWTDRRLGCPRSAGVMLHPCVHAGCQPIGRRIDNTYQPNAVPLHLAPGVYKNNTPHEYSAIQHPALPVHAARVPGNDAELERASTGYRLRRYARGSAFYRVGMSCEEFHVAREGPGQAVRHFPAGQEKVVELAGPGNALESVDVQRPALS